MPWRLFSLVVILGLALAFVGFNLENTCSVSFGFAVIEDVPVFFPLISAFTIGMLFSFPFVFRGKPKLRNVKRPLVEDGGIKAMPLSGGKRDINAAASSASTEKQNQ